jgi:flagellar hook-associated protein 1 FlgK
VRADAVSKAQVLASTLNDLSAQVQTLRREAEAKITTSVDDVNQVLKTLETLNIAPHRPGHRPQLARHAARSARPAVFAGGEQIVDLRVDYRADGSRVADDPLRRRPARRPGLGL